MSSEHPSLSPQAQRMKQKVSSWSRQQALSNWGFPTRMVYLHYTSYLRYTILVGNPRNGMQPCAEVATWTPHWHKKLLTVTSLLNSVQTKLRLAALVWRQTICCFFELPRSDNNKDTITTITPVAITTIILMMVRIIRIKILTMSWVR